MGVGGGTRNVQRAPIYIYTHTTILDTYPKETCFFGLTVPGRCVAFATKCPPLEAHNASVEWLQPSPKSWHGLIRGCRWPGAERQ